MLTFRATLLAFGNGLFAAMLLFPEVGRRIGVRRMEKYGDAARTGVGKADAPVYALLALLIGFMFSGAGARFDHRRELVTQQVNAIRTSIRAGVQGYVDVLLPMYRGAPSRAEALREPPEVSRARSELWSRAVSATLAAEGEKALMLLLPALNEMFAVGESERIARRIHSPGLVLFLLGIAALAVALFAGYGLASTPSRNWMYTIGIAASVTGAMYVIIELEYPRLGLVRVDAMDQALTELRETMR